MSPRHRRTAALAALYTLLLSPSQARGDCTPPNCPTIQPGGNQQGNTLQDPGGTSLTQSTRLSAPPPSGTATSCPSGWYACRGGCLMNGTEVSGGCGEPSGDGKPGRAPGKSGQGAKDGPAGGGEPRPLDLLRNQAYANYQAGKMALACSQAMSVLSSDPADKAARAIMHFACGADKIQAPPPQQLPAPQPSEPDPAALGVTDIDKKLGAIPPVESSPGESQRLSKRARESFRSGKFADARDQASRALSIDPSNADARYLRAQANAGLGDYRGSIADADAGLRSFPDNVLLLDQKAYAQNKAGDHQGALETARAALRLGPMDAAALANLAYALGALGDREGMLAALRKAAALDPRFQQSLDSALEPPTDAVFLFPGETRPAQARGEPTRPDRSGLALALGAGALIFLIPLLAVAAWAALSARGLTPADAPDSTPAAVPRVALGSAARPAQLLRDRYQLGRQIGVGGMGRVYEARDHQLGRTIAVKRMREELRSMPAELERFLQEAHLISQLSHPFIVAIHDAFQEGGETFLVFDFVDGKTLAAVLAERKRLPPGECRAIMTQVCDAVGFAHHKRVLHRDLKPGNIMIAGDGHARVMDFGLARELKDSLSRVTSLHEAGTPAYMAPEQHLGQASPASDLYALGVCLYEMLTGALPFQGPDFLRQKQAAAYRPAREIVGTLPGESDALFAVLLAADPARRAPDARKVLELIDRLPG